MGFIKGLAAVKEELDKRGGDFAERVPATWISIKGGEAVKLVFLQEIDEASPNYSEKLGTALFSLEHQNPQNYKKSAKCTADEGDCFGCSQGWRQKVVLYVNALMLDGPKAGQVGIWSRAIGKGSVAQSLLNMAADEDYDNSISDKTFKFTRTGSTKDDTTYSLDNLGKPHKKNLEDFADQLWDLEEYVFTVAPERQEAYYLDLKKGDSAPSRESKPVSPTSVDADW